MNLTVREAFILAWAIGQKKRTTLKRVRGKWIVGGIHQ